MNSIALKTQLEKEKSRLATATMLLTKPKYKATVDDLTGKIATS